MKIKLLFLVLSFLVAFAGRADDNVLQLKGKTLDRYSGTKLDGVSVKVYDGGIVCQSMISNKGKYSSENFAAGKLYEIVYSKAGYVSIKVKVDCLNNYFEEDFDPETELLVDVELVLKHKNIDYSEMPELRAEAKINSSSGLLGWSDNVGRAYSEKVKAFMKNEEEYLKLMILAKKALNDNDYDTGISKIDEADTKLSSQPLSIKLRAEFEKIKDNGQKAQYLKIIQKADQYFDEENLDKAESLYLRALGLDPNDEHAKKRLKLIDKKRKILVIEDVPEPEVDPVEEIVEETEVIEPETPVVEAPIEVEGFVSGAEAPMPNISKERVVLGGAVESQKDAWIEQENKMKARERVYSETIPSSVNNRNSRTVENGEVKVGLKKREYISYEERVAPINNNRNSGKNADQKELKGYQTREYVSREDQLIKQKKLERERSEVNSPNGKTINRSRPEVNTLENLTRKAKETQENRGYEEEK